MQKSVFPALVAALIGACATAPQPSASQPSAPRLLVWAQDADSSAAPFVALLDADSASPGYGTVLSSLALGAPGDDAHHTELTLGGDGTVWVNSFAADATYLVDARDPAQLAMRAALARAPGFSHPHTVLRSGNGRLLVTYQQGATHGVPGGLVEHDASGAFVRGASAVEAGSSAYLRPYSLALLPALDRVVTTGADMHGADVSRVVQVWARAELRLLQTLALPEGPRGDENAHTFEPRVLPDGRTVLVVTLGCGLYRVDGLDGDSARATLVHDFGARRCFMPAVVGDWWVQAVASDFAIDVLDVRDPEHPRRVHRLQLPDGWMPHWLSSDGGDRIVVTGYRAMASRLLLLRLDPATGILTVEGNHGGATSSSFEFDRPSWPHGETGAAIPHGAVFVGGDRL